MTSYWNSMEWNGMMKPLNCPNLFVQQSLSGSTVSLKMNFFHIFFKLQGIRTTRFTWLTWHLPSVFSSFFHFFLFLRIVYSLEKNPLRLPKSLFAQFHRAAPHSWKTTWCLLVYTAVICLHDFNHIFFVKKSICQTTFWLWGKRVLPLR